MNKADFLVAVGSFAAGVAAGCYMFGGRDKDRDIFAKESDSHRQQCKECQMAKHALMEKDTSAPEEVAEVVFFPDLGYACDDFLFCPEGCKSDNCKFLHEKTSLAKMCQFLMEAQKSIDVCIYTLGNDQLVSGLMHALSRAVQVRVIIDHTMATSASKQLNRLGPKGALIHEAASNYLMHNKFVVIDNKIAMTGSFNWTVQGSHGNYENVAIFSNKKLVQQYAAKFEQLWLDFADLRVPSHPGLSKDPNAFNPLKRAAWDGIIVGYEAPVNNHNGPRNRRPETRK